MTPRSRITLALQRLVLRSGRTRAGRRLWPLAYQGIAKAAGAWLTWGDASATVYIRGSLGAEDLVPGLSDVDLAIVVASERGSPGAAGARPERRWKRLRKMPLADLMLDQPRIYEDADLRSAAGVSAFTYGLDSIGSPTAAGLVGGGATLDTIRMLGRPGLGGTPSDWRLLTGPDRRPPEPAPDPQRRRIAAWLELVHWWRSAFPVCLDPRGPRAADLSVKLVAEPARIWLWLAVGERAEGRADVLRKAMRRLPDEEEAFRLALDLHRRLPDTPEAPLDEALRALLRLSARIAGLLAREVADEGLTEVRISGDPAELIARPAAAASESTLRPLADWRALAAPVTPDETLAPLAGDPGDPAVVGALTAASRDGPYPVLRAGGLIVLPGWPWERSRLRAVQCPLTDPVSFAVLDGDGVACFPRVRGWSAEDSCRRAVAEHLAWLRAEPGARRSPDSSGDALGLLFTAGRAALFEESLAEGDPTLPLTVTETARRLEARSTAARTVAEDALGRYREFASYGNPPLTETVRALRSLVLSLPPYSRAHEPSGGRSTAQF